MKFIVTTCKGREECVDYLSHQIPNLIVNKDDFDFPGIFKSTAWFNYRRSFQLAGNEACLMMEDDIVLCQNFVSKALSEIEKDPFNIITFFSMKKKDAELGTRYMPGKTFMMMQCVYYPAEFSRFFVDYMDLWYKKRVDDPSLQKHFHCPIDIVVAEYLNYCKVNYKIVVPNLVQHLGLKSEINPKRNPGRYSTTYKHDPTK